MRLIRGANLRYRAVLQKTLDNQTPFKYRPPRCLAIVEHGLDKLADDGIFFLRPKGSKSISLRSTRILVAGVENVEASALKDKFCEAAIRKVQYVSAAHSQELL